MVLDSIQEWDSKRGKWQTMNETDSPVKFRAARFDEWWLAGGYTMGGYHRLGRTQERPLKTRPPAQAHVLPRE